MKALLVLLILGTLFSSVVPRKNFARNVDSAEGDDDVNWYKELNNLLSVASQNLIVSGEFLTLYPFSNLDRLPAKGTCDRRITVDLNKPEKFDGILEKIYDTGIIKIGVTSLLSLPYYSNATGTPTGFFYDLGNSVANEIGFLLKKTIRARFVTFPTTNFQNDALAALSSGLVDTVIGTSYTVARSTLFDYSCWYETPSPFAVWVNPSHTLPIATPTTLSGFNNPAIKVATLGGSIFETAVIKYLPLAQRVSFPTMNAAYASVGVTTDISFSIIGETEAFAQANNNVIVIVPGTRVEFGGGNAFSTRRV